MKAANLTPELHIAVVNRHPRVFVQPSFIKKIASYVLKKEGLFVADLSFIFVSDAVIKRLNKKYLSKHTATDVLAFDLNRGRMTGDIVISLDTARRSAQSFKVSFKDEVSRYCIHGMLHLAGYDDRTKILKNKMWKRQELLLKTTKD